MTWSGESVVRSQTFGFWGNVPALHGFPFHPCLELIISFRTRENGKQHKKKLFSPLPKREKLYFCIVQQFSISSFSFCFSALSSRSSSILMRWRWFSENFKRATSREWKIVERFRCRECKKVRIARRTFICEAAQQLVFQISLNFESSLMLSAEAAFTTLASCCASPPQHIKVNNRCCVFRCVLNLIFFLPFFFGCEGVEHVKLGSGKGWDGKKTTFSESQNFSICLQGS